MKYQTLLAITAILEILTGLALIIIPALVIRILLGAEITDPVVLTISRVGGSAILALGTACALARTDLPGKGLKALISGMLVYNTAVFATLANSALAFKTTPALFAALIIHFILAFICGSTLNKLK